ncbi:cellulase family glycosylhydrolase [Sphingopyxis sp. 550A]
MRVSAAGRLKVDGSRFRDEDGRHVILRGVNLGGDCKVPWPDGGTNFPTDFSDHRTVSFIGRPFPLSDADAHLGRLAHWGFNCLRLLTTWEAIEHAGPGDYDQEYLDYYAEICARAGRHGLHVFVDFHQDVWSRMSGGDGAPGWVFEAVGLDFRQFDRAGAAHIMQARYDYSDPQRRQDAYPQMSWGGNHRLPANAVMWSLFWAGNRLTPRFAIDGVNIQDYLQTSYIGCLEQVAARVADMPHVIGFDTLNEPGLGWLGYPMNYRHVAPDAINPVAPRVGPALTPLEGLLMLRGLAVEAPQLLRNIETGRTEVTGMVTLNPHRQNVWLPGRECPFEAAGAYRIEGEEGVALREDYFRADEAGGFDVYGDGMGPFFNRVADAVRRYRQDWLAFVEIDPFGGMSGRDLPTPLPEGSVNAAHWYDVKTLFFKRFETPTGEARDAVRARFIDELGVVEGLSRAQPGGMPTLIGEFGIPFDLDEGAAYDAWEAGERGPDIWAPHSAALGLMYDAMDHRLLSSTMWNYTASNRNDLLIGDGWNQEDLSIFSLDQCEDPADPHSGGRAISGFCRPYAQFAGGTISQFGFDSDSGRFELTVDAVAGLQSIIYVPEIHFPDGLAVAIEGARASWTFDQSTQRLAIDHEASGAVTIRGAPSWLS